MRDGGVSLYPYRYSTGDTFQFGPYYDDDFLMWLEK